MELTVRPMLGTEHLYCYRQSQQISSMTGLIGHLRADMDPSGKGFFSTFFDFSNDLKTPEFKAELDEVINALRNDQQYGGMLKDRSSLSWYCHHYPQSKIYPGYHEYGFRADSAQYAYMLRLNPQRGEYNLYCYCYRRDWLNQHLERASQGIRFIDSSYKELFRLTDGDKIRLKYEYGEPADYFCRFIDEYHLEVNHKRDTIFHICEFAETVERHHTQVIPLRSSLPEKCYSVLKSNGDIILLKKGESGYYRTDIGQGTPEQNRELVETQNRMLGVTKAQAAAMSAGSMYGWHTPAADPVNYDAKGHFLKPHNREGGAR